MLKSLLSVIFLLLLGADARLGYIGMIAMIGAPDQHMTDKDLEIFTKIGQDLLGFPIHVEEPVQALSTVEYIILLLTEDSEGTPTDEIDNAGPGAPAMEAEVRDGLPGPRRASPPGASPTAEQTQMGGVIGTIDPCLAGMEVEGIMQKKTEGTVSTSPPGLRGPHSGGTTESRIVATSQSVLRANSEPYPDRITKAVLDEWSAELVASGLPFFENLEGMTTFVC